jgi:lipoprotein-anchoring transpeptidase ErfK/SrfK
LPSSDGLFARRYVEVDGSRQLIFIWDNGKYRTFRMSGAFLEYNPVGVHRIINKSRLAWSSTANKWMPYWMAFTFDKNQRAWLGFHSLVYWYPGYKQTGEKKIYEPITNIGKPRSTGCLRMSEKDSKALYDWARVDDWVVVHN